MSAVAREEFVPEEYAAYAYVDEAMPLAHQRMLPPPLLTGMLLEAAALKPGEKVLQIGSAFGYLAAVLHHMETKVGVLEEHAEFAGTTRQNLQKRGYQGIAVHSGAFDRGWPQNAPYDCILVSGAMETLSEAWLDQLSAQGRIVWLKGSWHRPGSRTALSELMLTGCDGASVRFGQQLYAPMLSEASAKESFSL
jgi:protein-L-isoaspartate(D-aspartate) O-methyltransferase